MSDSDEASENSETSVDKNSDEELFLGSLKFTYMENEGIVNLLVKEEDNPKDLEWAEDVLSPNDLNVIVEGLGNLTFPLTTTIIGKLINMSSKAKFGLGEQTLIDEKVRNTHQISSDKLNVTIEKVALNRLLLAMRDGLNLPGNTSFVPHLHDLLIYESGQFFACHRDSEKLDGMIATLVIVLPSPHVGGNLLIHARKKVHAFSTENLMAKDARCVAFYADCKHEITEVKEGYRVALTYNLVLKTEESNEPLVEEPKVDQDLKEGVYQYFSGRKNNKRRTSAVIKKKKKLVYFLNHSYSEHGLKWSLLKGIDRKRTAAFRLVAKELGLVPSLGLVKIQESWSTESQRCAKSEITMSYCIGLNNETYRKELDLDDEEICWAKGNEAFKPTKIDYDGYTGNEGHAVDYWYRRAAIILWTDNIF